MSPRILSRLVDYRCPWLEVVLKEVELEPPRGRERFYGIRTGDYTAILAVTDDGRIPLVRQFRPVVEADVLELPSGSIEPGEDAESASRRELLEETGCQASRLELLGCLHTDSGRMETRQWAFFAPDAPVVAAAPTGDEQLELVFVETDELRRLIAAGEFRQAIHLGIVCTALARGLLVF